MWWLAIVVALGGCFSWTQQDPPPREDWNLALERDCDGPGTAVAALGAAVIAGGVAAAIFASTTDSLGDLEERSLAMFLTPLSIGWAADAANAYSDGTECERYRGHRTGRGA